MCGLNLGNLPALGAGASALGLFDSKASPPPPTETPKAPTEVASQPSPRAATQASGRTPARPGSSRLQINVGGQAAN